MCSVSTAKGECFRETSEHATANLDNFDLRLLWRVVFGFAIWAFCRPCTCDARVLLRCDRFAADFLASYRSEARISLPATHFYHWLHENI